MISSLKRLWQFYIKKGWMPIVTVTFLTGYLFALWGGRILYPSHFSDKSVSLGFIIILNLGYIPSCVYCFRDGRWIWGSAQALIFLLYTLALIQLHI